MALSLTTPGHDVYLQDPASKPEPWTVLEAGITAVAATSPQWVSILDDQNGGPTFDLEHVVVAEEQPDPALETWLRHVYPEATVSYALT